MFKSCSTRTIPTKTSYFKISQGQKHCSREIATLKKTGIGPPMVMTSAENVWCDLFHDTVYCTGIVDDENFQEVGLGGNLFT